MIKRRNKILLLVNCLFFCLLNLSFAQSFISIDKENADRTVTVDIIESTPEVYKAKINIHKIKYSTIIVGSNTYKKLYFENNYTLQKVGEPALPLLIQHIGLPYGCSYKAELVEEKWINIPIGRIYPSQKPLITTNSNETFIISEDVYKDEQYSSVLLDNSDIMHWKGIDNVYLSICPFKYFPLKGILSVLSEFTLIVSFNKDKKNDGDIHLLYEEADLKIFDNKDFLNNIHKESPDKSISPSIDYDYLIIVGNIPEIENSQAMKDFRKWKALKGYKTKMVSTTSIGTDSASIKSYITQQYRSGIKRVLFVGNEDKIPIPTFPARHCQYDHPVVMSDYWYGCTDGVNDIQGNLPIARFVSNTLNDFANIVNKTIKYESLYHDWANRVLLVSYEQQIPSLQAPLDKIYNSYSQTMDIYKAFAASVENGGNGATILDVLDYINDGINIVTVNAHGNAGGFWLFDGNNSTLNYTHTGLLNNDTYPVFFSNACSNGNFTCQYSILNDFMCSDHCSSAWIGSSVPSYLLPQNQLTQILYSKLLNDNQWFLGDLLLESHIANLGYGNTAIDNAFSYIYGGDPTLELWTGNQNVFEDVEVCLLEDSLQISVANISNYDVNICTENGELIGKYNSNGCSISFPLSSGKYDLAICKHNYIPYIIQINTDSQYIQNKIISGNSFYGNTPITIGYDVTSSIPYGNVVIEPNAKLVIRKGAGVTIENGFECQNGGELIIK